MNLKQQEQTPVVVDEKHPPLPALTSMAKPMGKFAGEGDFILRIHDGKVAPANT